MSKEEVRERLTGVRPSKDVNWWSSDDGATSGCQLFPNPSGALLTA